ncbi:hypothetical protein COY90_05405 [Candidatus Roizmanbacteria bacterium CG_4_10_14_0_8_um_filter_39_9]|uniref:Membrane protein 6-pyruvoyl-tetrahydropterin synthase-related domain-containing protein n=1 Tax=Candidatus Roizmanbacteria bacterium CG_4_10_14_0_8_um_filter_39_9 TaxID=1974829 RepID=A0A2M7QBC9_9BACT|nr:MAG: hypothetical protein COY90_05405 [Candidatus Roizmanbacteria bacterium CG_4_10_14_0_8_um_filter_39_9]
MRPIIALLKKYERIIIFIICLTAVIFFLGSSLNPFDPRMFDFHDDTQAARIQQFALNIKAGNIFPRVAPDLSFGLGFPVFNFYAPFSYWVTTGIHLIGIPIPIAIKTSFLLAIVSAFIAMYLFLKRFFSEEASLLGGAFYSSSIWFAIEIFVRGNLGEIWFLALFPLTLSVLHLHSEKLSRITFILGVLILSALFTVHNVLSLISLIIIGSYILLLPHKKQLLSMFVLALLLGSYFLIPALLESHLTYASYVAEKTNFHDHFLCLKQIWTAPTWEFGGSGPGCDADTMPFVLGKIHIVLGLLGVSAFLLRFRREKKHRKIYSFIGIIGLVSLFLTLYPSSFIWNLFAPVFSLFQFPWRFLVFGSFFFAFFSGYLFNAIRIPFKKIVAFFFIGIILFTSSKYFSKPWLYSTNEILLNLVSDKYIAQKAAYHMAEYLPKTANYTFWRSFENAPLQTVKSSPFQKEYNGKLGENLTLNIHYFPFWKVEINDKQIIPSRFDQLGRPILSITEPSIVRVTYEQTTTEQLSNNITIITFALLLCILLYKPLWNKLRAILK